MCLSGYTFFDVGILILSHIDFLTAWCSGLLCVGFEDEREDISEGGQFRLRRGVLAWDVIYAALTFPRHPAPAARHAADREQVLVVLRRAPAFRG